jgi:hypothetical protein
MYSVNGMNSRIMQAFFDLTETLCIVLANELSSKQAHARDLRYTH